MSALQLFTAFHGNLDFSAIPEAERALVIGRCYWPLLALPRTHGIRIGLELSARTLEILGEEDPEWLKAYLGLVESGWIEPIASGHAQVVGPLAPCSVNRWNLALGAKRYREIFGGVPETWFVNEQTWSDGLAPLYAEVGAQHVVMEWNNPAARREELRALRGRPARLRLPEGGGPVVLWNDSIVFQKVQRVAHGEVPVTDLLDYLERLAQRPGASCLCLYGGDVEIFDYRPSRRAPRRRADALGEMDRLIALFAALGADPRYRFVLPGEVAAQASSLPEVSLGSAGDPIPCKKQPRYNPTRWAVSGRDGFGMNTRCEGLLREARAIQRLAPDEGDDASTRALVDLWRSDFRTRATEEKLSEFEAGLGLARARTRTRLETLAPELAEGEDLVLANPAPHAWAGGVVEVPMRLPPGRAGNLALVVRRGPALREDAYQIDVHGRHRDGTLRDVTLVLAPTIDPHGLLALALEPKTAVAADGEDEEADVVRTDHVDVHMLGHRGGAIDRLLFPRIADRPLVGTIPHGHFEEIAYTPDFYSGHVVALTESGEKRADLARVTVRRREALSGPVRTCVESVFESSFGPWRKRLRVYRNAPRIELVHDLSFHDARLASLRLGMVTLRPEAWDLASLSFGTVNGGPDVEWHALGAGAKLGQSQAVSSAVSATSCLGATEGWVALRDRTHGVLVSTDRARAATAAMLDFEAVDDGFFCRLTHTAAETDETRASFLRGRLTFAFSIEGFRAEDQELPEVARRRHEGLVLRTRTGVGVVGGL